MAEAARRPRSVAPGQATGGRGLADDAAGDTWRQRTRSRSQLLDFNRGGRDAHCRSAGSRLLQLQSDIHLYEDNELMHEIDRERVAIDLLRWRVACWAGIVMLLLGVLSIAVGDAIAATWLVTHLSSLPPGWRIASIASFTGTNSLLASGWTVLARRAGRGRSGRSPQ